MRRRSFLLYVDLDIRPTGLMHSEASAMGHIQKILREFFRRYDPTIEVAPAGTQWPQHERSRKAYLIQVNLDPSPGVMYTEGSAVTMIDRVMGSTITSSCPQVYLAPDELQPKEGK